MERGSVAEDETFPEIREAIRRLCATFPGSYRACIQTHGGFGFAEEFDIERKFRETRLYQVAPISTNLILSHVGTHVLGLQKSF
jgi:alkylation response protein AidB-like acyl-CoA dehydrogenase